MSKWKLVPVEPTPGMLYALWQHREAMRGQSENKIARASYDALLAASPPAPAGLAEGAIAYIQKDHLQKAMRAPFLCRVEPTKRLPDFVPICIAPAPAAGELPPLPAFSYFLENSTHDMQRDAIRAYAKNYARLALASASPPPVVQQAPVQPAGVDIINTIIRDVAELDNAPTDTGELIVSPEDLRVILERNLAATQSDQPLEGK